MNYKLVTLIFALLVQGILSYQIQGKIDNKGIQALQYHEIQLKVVGANGFNKIGFVNADGKFNIYVGEPGVYKLEAFHLLFFFEPVIVDILSEEKMLQNPSKKQIQAFIYKMNGAAKGVRLLYPLQLDPSHKVRYFDIEEPFNPIQYLKSPYVLMMGLPLLMTVMMKAVPKEEMEAY